MLLFASDPAAAKTCEEHEDCSGGGLDDQNGVVDVRFNRVKGRHLELELILWGFKKCEHNFFTFIGKKFSNYLAFK